MWLGVRSGDGWEEEAGRRFEGGQVVVGRDRECDLIVDDERVARRHARLTWLPGGSLVVEDLGSADGTWVDGNRITTPVTVGTASEIRIGGHLITRAGPDFSVPPRAPAPAAAVLPPPPSFPPGQLQPASRPVLAPQSRPPVSQPPAQWAPVRPLGPPPPGPPVGLTPAGLSPLPLPAPPPYPPPVGRRRRKWPYLTGGAVVIVAVVAALLITEPLATTRTYTPAQLAADWGPSTLYVQTDVGGKPLESGTAWVLNASKGLVVTNAHVVDSGPPKLSGLGSSPATSYRIGQGVKQQPAALVAVSPCQDLAVLRIGHTRGLKSFVLGEESQVRDGDTVTALGYPGAGTKLPSLTLDSGVVSDSRTSFNVPSLETPEYTDLIQTTANINPGNSGGPLLNDRGQIVGVTTASITEENNRIIQGEGFAIGIDRVRSVVKSLAVGRSEAFAGFNFVFPDSNADFSAFGLSYVPGGIIIPTADIGSPAYEAGFGHGQAMVISAINGKKLAGDLPSYCKLVGDLTAGQAATFTAESVSGSTHKLKVTFK